MKLSKGAAERAKKAGAEVTSIRKVQRPAPLPEPEVEAKEQISPELPDTSALEASIAELRQALTDQETTSQKRIQELSAMVEALSADKPVRLKVQRNMKRGTETYLLMDYIDVIPVAFTRKLDS